MKIKAMGVLTDSLRTYNLQKGDLDELYGIFRSVNDYDIPIVRYIIYPSSGLIRQRINPPDFVNAYPKIFLRTI